jgi:hypothetical protein
MCVCVCADKAVLPRPPEEAALLLNHLGTGREVKMPNSCPASASDLFAPSVAAAAFMQDALDGSGRPFGLQGGAHPTPVSVALGASGADGMAQQLPGDKYIPRANSVGSLRYLWEAAKYVALERESESSVRRADPTSPHWPL